MAEGWVKLHRSITENWIWENPQYLKWWLDLILMANHKKQKIPFNDTFKIEQAVDFYSIEQNEIDKEERITQKELRQLTFLKRMYSDLIYSGAEALPNLKKIEKSIEVELGINYQGEKIYHDEDGNELPF